LNMSALAQKHKEFCATHTFNVFNNPVIGNNFVQPTYAKANLHPVD